MQILASVGASSYHGFLPFLPPIPPAPPSFTLAQNSFPPQPQQLQSSSQQSHHGRQSPSVKRTHDENSNNNNKNRHQDDDKKRARYEPGPVPPTRSHNFDEENIAPVPSLLDANVNTLKKYLKKCLIIINKCFLFS
jgi:hypothetical protein